ncbi:putative L-type amino acid transporter 1-like protein MLAS [Octopus sinensis]|uniref:L-type amino acid transporter 1-like protein MLAS n=1 Tax=Octopus sinensis TaxID=2607531 RepID=A0A7E6EHT2_9MOLL|nr:putative L-type amino acid transporter 1-like protein MLAS [Octopus sinensis]
MENTTQDTLETSDSKIVLQKNLTLFNSITLVVGSVIGSGIFISSSSVLKQTGSIGLTLIVWINCGLISLFGSLCYAELGTMIPSSGGEYIYIMKAFGSLAAFVRIWIELVVIRPSLNAIVALTFGIYLLKPIYPVISYMAVLSKVQIIETNAIAIVNYFSLFFIAARHDHMPMIINTVNTKFKTPIVAMIITV